jgi:uncharacterized membrane protein
VLSVLCGLLVAGPIMFGGSYLQVNEAVIFGKLLFFLCWGIALIMWFIFIIGLVGGKYKKVPERDWREQVW